METLLITAFVFLCVLFAIVLTLQIAAERELKIKTRRLQELESRSAEGSAAEGSQRERDARLQEMERKVAELTEQNTQLQAESATLREEHEAVTKNSDRQDKPEEQIAGTERHGEKAKTEAYGSRNTAASASATEVPALVCERTAQQAIRNETSHGRKSYIVVSGVVFVLVSGAILTAGLWRDYIGKGTLELSALPANKAPAVEPVDKEGAASPLSVATPGDKTDISSPAKQPTIHTSSSEKLRSAPGLPKRPETSTANPQDARNTTQANWYRYEILAPTPVYSKPTEESQTVASAIIGMKVNVVAVHGDWLEIRSRHGRPPGFIKKSSATPASRN